MINLTQHEKSCPYGNQNEACTECRRKTKTRRLRRWKVLLCLLPAFFVSSMDLTIVATATPFIASHFGELNQLSWIANAYALTEASFVLPFAQAADVFGRYAALQFAVIALLVGGTLCASAPVWPVLILGRAFQGMGSAGMNIVVLIVLADNVTLKEQAINTTIFHLLVGVGYAVGPVIGGYITNASWRYIFVMTSGISLVSVVTVFLLRNDLRKGLASPSNFGNAETRTQAILRGFRYLDLTGLISFITAVALLVIGTSWGGNVYSWTSPAVLVPLIVGGALLIFFVSYQLLMEPGRPFARLLPKTVPAIPAQLLRSKDVWLIFSSGAALGASLYSIFYYAGIYFALAEGRESQSSGINLLYYLPGLGGGTYAAIYMCNRNPRQTFWPLVLGSVTETVGIAVLAYATRSRDTTIVNVMMAVTGFGTGIRFMPLNLHLSGMYRDRLAPVFAMLEFSQSLGGVLGLTIMGAVFQGKLGGYLGNVLPGQGADAYMDLMSGTSLDTFAALPEAEREHFMEASGKAISWAFISLIPIVAIGLLGTTMLGNVWISPQDKKSAKSSASHQAAYRASSDNPATSNGHELEIPDSGPEDGDEARQEILDGIYLLSLYRNTVETEKKLGPVQAKVEESATIMGQRRRDDVAELPR